MNRLTDFLRGVSIGEPQTAENMSIYPLHVKNGHSRGYQTLDEGLSAKTIEVVEVSQGGSVPTLTVRNTGKHPVLLIVGEELIGARQNRVLNTSLLVPAQSDLNIPVSCVEQGRWAYNTSQFDSGKTSSHLKLRKMQTENVTANLRATKQYNANQNAVWHEVETTIKDYGTTTRTRALHEVYEQSQAHLQEYVGRFTPPKAEGVLVSISGQIAGADIFDHAETLSLLWPKLVRSYALDALRSSTKAAEAAKAGAAPAIDMTDTQRFLASVEQAGEEVYDSVGIGKDVRLSSEQVSGSALLWEDHLIHDTLFNALVK